MAAKKAIVLGLVLAIGAGALARFSGLAPAACWTAAITALCASWWVLEPIPIPATSLIPFALFPLTGVLNHEQVATAYGDTLILLLLGGFILSTAMERSGAHQRLALFMVRIVGGQSRRRLVLGFMLATALLSMWISNTATVLMMLPVALAVLDQDGDREFAAPLLLGVAYAASIGGLGTPIGTPPNIIFMGVYKVTSGQELSFLDWMKVGVPVTLLLIPIAWWLLTRRLTKPFRPKLPKLGAWRSIEKRVIVLFSVTALLWMTRGAPFGGWTGWFGLAGVGDSTIALGAAALLFLLPDGDGGRMLDWQTANRIPWGLLLLFGGGIAIADAFKSSGLSLTLGSMLSSISSWPLWLTILAIALSVSFLTEVTSNTATATLLMPVMAAAATGAQIEPALLMAPAALSASCAFMLPVATAPNAIVLGTERFSPARMAREGFFLNLAAAAVITAICLLLLGR